MRARKYPATARVVVLEHPVDLVAHVEVVGADALFLRGALSTGISVDI